MTEKDALSEKYASDLARMIYFRLAAGKCQYYGNECNPDTCLKGRKEEGVCIPKEDGKIDVMVRATCVLPLIAKEISKKYSINKK